MQKLSNSFVVSLLFHSLLIVLVAKVLGLGLSWYLPNEGVQHKEQKNYQPPFIRYSFKTMLEHETPKRQQQMEQEQSATGSDGVSGIKINHMVLKGLYGKENHGIAVVALKSDPKKSEVLSVGESFSGFTLKKIFLESVLFDKDGQNYILSIEEKTTSGVQIKKAPQRKIENRVIDAPLDVKKKDIEFYAKNPEQIWKQISIIEVKKNGKIDGFKVTRIDPKSPFAALGLQKNDLIIKANNVRLNSYKDAIEIYNNIDKLESVQIVFLRDNQEMEIVYEIR